MSVENDLLAKIAQGDQRAFREFYDRFSSRVYNTAISYLQHAEDAEEIVQDVFLEIHRSAGTFRLEAGPGTWVYRITVNKSLDLLRKRKAKKRFGFVLPLFGAEETASKETTEFIHPGVLLEKREDAGILFRVIDTLPDQQKTAFILSYIEELPRQEVADIMEVTLKSVEGLLLRAKNNLRSRLDKYYPGRGKK